MFALERQQKIIELLNDSGAVSVSRLSEEMGVTEETVRRDLEKLEKKLRDEKVFDKYNFLFNKQEFFDSDNDVWGEPDHMEKDFSIDEISDMPAISANPTKIITVRKPMQKKNVAIPEDAVIQRYADNLYKEYGSEYEKSLFIAELSEKFPGLIDYEKYWYRAKSFYELNVL